MFTTWAALKKHLVGPAHTRMTVICPWCTKREKTFTRVADLKTHALNIHRLEGVQDRHFSRGVGFYFAKHPADYVRIVDYVADYADENAAEARSLMRKWAESMEGSVGLLERLNQGWKVEKNVGRSRGQEKMDKRKEEEESKSRERSRTEKEKSRSKERSRTDKEKSRSKERSGDRRTVMDKRSGFDEQFRAEKEQNIVRMNEKGDSSSRKDVRGNSQSRDKGGVESGSVVGEVDMPTKSVEKKRQRSKEREIPVSKKPRTIQQEESDEEGLESYKDDIRLEDDSATDSSDSESEEDDRSEVSSVASAVAQTEQLRVRATRILMRGAMPMCPPAQRDWSKISELNIEGDNGSMVWPPKNWRTMTPDQKLMAHEYAAMFLEQSKTGSFPVDLSRRALLDKYNFMAQEGAARPKPESTKHKADAKLRYYNFQYIRNVARGSVLDTRVSRSILTSMERADRWRDTDRMTALLDSANIKLRV